MLNLQWSLQLFPKTLILLERKKNNENAHQKWTSSPGLFQDEKRRWKSQIVPARLAQEKVGSCLPNKLINHNGT